MTYHINASIIMMNYNDEFGERDFRDKEKVKSSARTYKMVCAAFEKNEIPCLNENIEEDISYIHETFGSDVDYKYIAQPRALLDWAINKDDIYSRSHKQPLTIE